MMYLTLIYLTSPLFLRSMSYLVLTEEFPHNYKPSPVNANQPAKIDTVTLGCGAKLIVSEKYAKVSKRTHC